MPPEVEVSPPPVDRHDRRQDAIGGASTASRTRLSVLWKRIGDGVAIVTSILLAFGIDAWWDARGTRTLEQEYLAALASETRQALGEITADLNAQERLRTALLSYANGEPIEPDSLSRILRRASSVNNIAPPTAVIDELVSSGRLQVIRSREVREGVMLYRQMLDKVAANEEAHHEFVNTRFVPYLSQAIPLGGMVGPPAANGIRTATGSELAALQRDQRFQNLMLERLARIDRGFARLRSTQQQLQLLAAVLSEL